MRVLKDKSMIYNRKKRFALINILKVVLIFCLYKLTVLQRKNNPNYPYHYFFQPRKGVMFFILLIVSPILLLLGGIYRIRDIYKEIKTMEIEVESHYQLTEEQYKRNYVYNCYLNW